jgi:hypothetical protein
VYYKYIKQTSKKEQKMFAQSVIREKVGRFDEKTLVEKYWGTDAVKLAKSEAGKVFNGNKKVIEVKVTNSENETVLHLVKDPMTLECKIRVSA